MKKIMLAGLMMATTAHASDLKFGDLNYLLGAGNFTVGAQVDLRSAEQNLSDDFGSDVSETEGWYVDTLLTVGVMDNLNLFAGLNYQYDVEVSSETTPTEAKFYQDGLANPLVGGVFRILNQSDSMMNLDVGAIGRFAIADEEIGDASGSDSVDGNAAEGRNSLEVFGRVGQKWNEANEWQLSAGIVQHMSGESTQLGISGNDTDRDEDSSMDMYVKAAYQYRPVNEFMMSLAVQGTRVGDKETELDGGTTIEEDSHIDFDLTFKAKYLITSNFIANFTLGHGELADYDADVNGNAVELKQRKSSRMGVGVDWLF